MKALILITSLTAAFQASSAFAEFEKHQAQSIDFNKMIEANSQDVHKMKKDISENGFGERPHDASNHSKKVVDFLDVEVGWGEAPRVVDRRFNSVDEPKVVLIPKS